MFIMEREGREMKTFEHQKQNKSHNNIKDSFNSAGEVAKLNALENKKDKLKKQLKEKTIKLGQL